MTHRDRVLAAIAHGAVDRVPRSFIAKPEVFCALRQQLGLETDEALLQALDIDMRRVGHWRMIPPPAQDAEGNFRDIFGLRWESVTPTGLQLGLQYPFTEDSSVRDVHEHPWPDAAIQRRIRY